MIYFGQDKMSEFYYGGTEIKEMYLGSTKVFQNKHPLFLTLETDGHGTLTADVLSGFEGDTVTLAPTYNTYYRFSGYDCTGGTIAGNTFTFGQEDATAKANFSANKFTVTGNFNWAKYSVGAGSVSKKYDSKVRGITGSIPTSWGTVGQNWNPTTANVSGYKISWQTTITWTANTNASTPYGREWMLINGTSVQAGSQRIIKPSFNYALNGNSTKQGHPALSSDGWYASYGHGQTKCSPNAWTATGYLP